VAAAHASASSKNARLCPVMWCGDDRGASSVAVSSAPTVIGSSSFGRLIAIAVTAMCELLRERVLRALLLFALLLIVMTLLLGEVSVGQERRIVLDVGLGAIRALGTVMAILMGVRLLEREIEHRTIAVLLTKPVRRWEVIVGKFCGCAVVLLISVGIMTAGLVGILAVVTSAWTTELLLLLPVVFLFWLQFLLAAAFAIAFSTFSTPTLSVIFALSIVLIGHASREFLYWAETVRSPALASLSRALYYGLPNLQHLNFTAAIVHRQEIAWSAIGMASAYATLYLAVVLLLAAILFHRREFQ